MLKEKPRDARKSIVRRRNEVVEWMALLLLLLMFIDEAPPRGSAWDQRAMKRVVIARQLEVKRLEKCIVSLIRTARGTLAFVQFCTSSNKIKLNVAASSPSMAGYHQKRNFGLPLLSRSVTISLQRTGLEQSFIKATAPAQLPRVQREPRTTRTSHVSSNSLTS